MAYSRPTASTTPARNSTAPVQDEGEFQSRLVAPEGFTGNPAFGIPKFVIRMLPKGAELTVDGKKPWVYVNCTIMAQEKKTKPAEGKQQRIYVDYSGKTWCRDPQLDPQQDKFMLKVTGGTPQLAIQRGERKKDFTGKSKKSKDGLTFTATSDVELVCNLKKNDQQGANVAFSGFDDNGNEWQLLHWKSKESRAKGGGDSFNEAAKVFG